MRHVTALAVMALLGVSGAAVVYANNACDGDGPTIMISPNVLVLSSDVACVTVHSNIPYGLLDPASLALNGVAPYLTKRDSLGHLVAKFHVDDIESVVGLGPVTLTLTGAFTDGTPLEAADTITVKE